LIIQQGSIFAMASCNDKPLRIIVFISKENIWIYGGNNLLAALHNNQNWLIFDLIAF